MTHCPGCGHPMSPPEWGAHMFGCGFKGERVEDHEDRGEFMIDAYSKKYTKNRGHIWYSTVDNTDVLERALESIWDKLKSNEIDKPEEAAPLLYNSIGQQLNRKWDSIKKP